MAMTKRYGSGWRFKSVQSAALTNMMNPGVAQLVIAETGGGKSALFEIPLTMGHGVAIIVSYIALAASALDTLKKAGLPAQLYTGRQAQYQKGVIFSADTLAMGSQVWEDLTDLVETGRVQHIIYDEVHCLLTSGLHFRPNLLEIQRLRTLCGPFSNNRPSFTGLSATISPRDVELLRSLLMEPNLLVVRGPTARPNLAYSVRAKPSGSPTSVWVERQLTSLLDGLAKGEKMIVYAKSIAEVDRLAKILGCDVSFGLPMSSGIALNVCCRDIIAKSRLGGTRGKEPCWTQRGCGRLSRTAG